VNLADYLPEALRTPTTTVTRIAAGLSGAGVYRVEADGAAYVLKVAAEATPLEAWERRVAVQRAAADAGVAPRVLHVVPERRAVVSELVTDRGFIGFLVEPATRAGAMARLGRTLRRVHDLPIPDGATPTDPRALIDAMSGALAGFAPPFVHAAVARVREAPPPSSGRAPVLSHNDVNPTNLVWDGERLVLLDWDVAAPNDPLYDLAAAAVFLRFDDATCAQLIAAHDDAPEAAVPAAFVALRRLIAVMCGTIFLHLARATGHRGAADGDPAPPSLADVHAQMRAGALSVATADGKWAMGLALVREGAAY
jgi:aminoglycoside phosphotransferase (APT) family kinase protein